MTSPRQKCRVRFRSIPCESEAPNISQELKISRQTVDLTDDFMASFDQL
jgi:hypothetical protein